jgi:hypothetical protein
MRRVPRLPILLVLAALTAACDYRPPPTGPTIVTTTTVVTTTNNNPTPTPTPTPTPGTPTPGGGTGTRTPDPPSGAALPLPAYGQAEVLAYAATSAGAAALVTVCPGSATSWAFMDGLIDRLRQKDTRWGYFCKNGNCFDVSADVIGYHATAGPDVAGAAGTIGVDVIGDLCGSNTPQWVTYPFNAAALWTTRGRF